jgi:FlaA1/EpsC-like NDP-sugar epimerase
MGATKRVAELAVQDLAQRYATTRFGAVRFGNVIGSAGSVVPIFREQIRRGGPVTVTHPEMRRYFMTIPEAAQLVLQAASLGGSRAGGGEIFVLNMGEPVRIVDLARNLVLLSGLDPDRDIRIEFIGIRPGEKLYEELNALEENTVATQHSQIRIFSGPVPTSSSVSAGLLELRRAIDSRDAAGVVLVLKEMVPDYNPSSFILRRAMQTSEVRERARSVVA